MIRQSLLPVLVAGLIVLAGCASFAGPGLDSTNAPDSGSNDVQTGTVNFYISDERNAIDDFEHLNVTITKVGFQKAGDEDDEEADENESEDQDDANETETDANQTTVETTQANAQVNGTETATNASDTEDDESETDEEAEAENEDSQEENESREGWVEHDVDNVTVDLTEYQGANATLLSQFDLPNGTYNKVFIYISEINATLSNGEQVNVKLPSERLHLNEQFTVGNGQSIDFVFDLTVFKAGNSAKYILKPVASESGTDVPIEAERPEQAANASEAGEGGPPDNVGNNADENESDDGPGDPPAAAAFDVAADGPVQAGEDLTLTVTQDGDAVQNAQVFVDGERVGQTAADGTLTVSLPEDAKALEVTVKYQGNEVETTIMVESGGGDQTTTAAA